MQVSQFQYDEQLEKLEFSGQIGCYLMPMGMYHIGISYLCLALL